MYLLDITLTTRRDVPPADEMVSRLGTLMTRQSNYRHMQSTNPKMPQNT